MTEPKAIIFDVKGTLLLEEWCQQYPRSETLIGTLKNLKAKGVELYAVSWVACLLDGAGFPEGLLVKIEALDKPRGVKRILEQSSVAPEDMHYFGDDSLEERAAKMHNIPYTMVWGGHCNAEQRMEIENKLIELFGKEILGEKPKKEEPKEEPEEKKKKEEPKTKSPEPKAKQPPPEPISDLPKPKPKKPERWWHLGKKIRRWCAK